LTETLGCLGAPAMADLFGQPATAAEVWRERAFEVVIGGAWVTGVFDRVVITRDAAGHATRVLVVDFKTDRVMTDEETAAAVIRHAGQLNLYRGVAARLAALPTTAVECVLV